MEAVGIILAAGEGQRLGAGAPKAFLSVGGPTMVELAIRAADACPSVKSVVVTVPDGMQDAVTGIKDLRVRILAVVGGATRQESVAAALAAVSDVGATRVVIHDAARPFASAQLFAAVLSGLSGADGVIPVVPVTDTVKRVAGTSVIGTEPRDGLFLAQTPQAFRLKALRVAHERAVAAGVEVTDDAQALETAGFSVRVVPGETDNLKITTPTDLARAEAIIATGGILR